MHQSPNPPSLPIANGYAIDSFTIRLEGEKEKEKERKILYRIIGTMLDTSSIGVSPKPGEPTERTPSPHLETRKEETLLCMQV